MKGLISHAVEKGYLSSKYIQPLLVTTEDCLAPAQKRGQKKGEAFPSESFWSYLLGCQQV